MRGWWVCQGVPWCRWHYCGTAAGMPACVRLQQSPPTLHPLIDPWAPHPPYPFMHTQADANKRKMGAAGGLDAVLQAIAPYRNRDPETGEEEEYVENLFDVVASCLLLPENKAVFVEAEGECIACASVCGGGSLLLGADESTLSSCCEFG